MDNEHNTHETSEAPMPLGELSTDEQQMIGYLRAKQPSKAYALAGSLMNVPGWTYEHRLAFALLARLSLEGLLSDEVLNSPHSNRMELLIDALAETISDSLWALGGYTDLQKLFNDASCAPVEQGGAE